MKDIKIKKIFHNHRIVEKAILSLVILALPLLAVSFYIQVKQYGDFEQQLLRELSASSQFVEGDISILFEQLATRVADWATDGHIQEEVEKITTLHDSVAAAQLGVYIRENKQQLDPKTVLTDILDLSGTIIVSTDRSRVGFPPESRRTFDMALKAPRGEVYLTEVVSLPDHLERMKHVHLLTGIRSLTTGKMIGAIINHVNSSGMSDVLRFERPINSDALINNILLKKSPDVFLVNKNGLIIAASRETEKNLLREEIYTEPVRVCNTNHQAYIGSYKNNKGVDVYAASMCPSGQFWMLITEIEKNTVTQSYQQVQLIIFSLTGITLFFLVSMIILRFILLKKK